MKKRKVFFLAYVAFVIFVGILSHHQKGVEPALVVGIIGILIMAPMAFPMRRRESYRKRYMTDAIAPDGSTTNLDGEPINPPKESARTNKVPARERPVSQGGDLGYNRAKANNEDFIEGPDGDSVIKYPSDDAP